MTIESSETQLQEFVQLVLSNLEKNGFPTRTVAFPLEKMYESASQRGFSFNKVRAILEERGIATELTAEKVLFSQLQPRAAAEDLFDLEKTVQNILQQMSSEQQSQVAKMMQDLPAEDLEKLQREWEAMSAQERDQKMHDLEKFVPPPRS